MAKRSEPIPKQRKAPRQQVSPHPKALNAPLWRVIAGWAAIVIIYVCLRLPGIGVPLDRDEGARFEEFQRTMLDDVRRFPPKYIVSVMNVPYSLLWDNRADLDAIHSLEDLAQQNWDVDRVMLLSGTEGQWVDAQDPRIDADHPFISIFKKKP